MLNSLVLIGKVIEILKEESKLIIEIPKYYKNKDGEYGKDNFVINLFKENNCLDMFQVGGTIGIKGRLEIKDNELCIMAENVTFLESGKEEEK